MPLGWYIWQSIDILTLQLTRVTSLKAQVKLIYMLRVSAFGGKKILVLLKTLVSGAMREMHLDNRLSHITVLA